jgi:tRNA(fMet)-specific endonuclease VapC
LKRLLKKAVNKFIPMTGSSYLLDTNIITAWLKKDAAVAVNINSAEEVFVPIIAIGEMYYGAQFSTKIIQNIHNISTVLSNYQALYIDEEVCKTFGAIKSSLRRKGKPIPENDIWIAAIAARHELIVATRDQHFGFIDEVTVENW